MRKTALLFALLCPLLTFASSHREAPLITEDPTMDNTDLYVFRSPDAPDTITIIANYIPLEEPSNGPNFYNFSPAGVYEIHIDNNGDAKEDITYQFQFRTDIRNQGTFLYNTGPVLTLDDADLNVRQFYTVTRIAGARRTGNGTSLGTSFQVAPANIGPKSTPDYAALANAAVFSLGNNAGRVFAGPRDDPFFVDIGGIVDLLTLRPIQQLHRVPPTAQSAAGVDGLKGFNVHTIALQIPISQLVAGGTVPASATAANAVIGVWASASRSRVTILNTGATRRQSIGGVSQVSRLGMPLVNEVVLPLQFKDIFNGSEPAGDAPLFTSNETFRNRILDPEVAQLMNLLYGVDVPPAPRNDLVQVFLTGLPGANQPPNVVPAEMMRLNVAVPVTAQPNRLGALANDMGGFPNGRRLSDDVVDISLRVVAGVLVPNYNKSPNNALTDGVDANDRAFLSTFPYVALPHQGFDSRPHAN
ncbi:MAG TPA: DUF4331 domain-containing protein [Thermoanaerobaculia bacterium]|jgi:hypothetical protein|nr:DUF4331 domain-containing protein [Thermoanaerobaculia bacterium]